MKKFFCLILLAGILVNTSRRAQAQSGPEGCWQIFRDGLPATNVTAVLAAQDGALWFGTDRGASRYDGEWTALSVKNGLPGGRVRALAQTGDGALWLGLEGGGLARRGADGSCCRVWTTGEGLPAGDVAALLAPPSEQAGLWVGTARGLVYLDGEQPAAPAGLPVVGISALAAGPDGTIYAATEGRGLWQRAPDGAWRPVEGSTSLRGPVYSLLVDAGGRLWAGTDNGLLSQAGGAWKHLPLLANDTGLRVFSVLRDSDGGLWAGTEQGLFYVPRAPADPAQGSGVRLEVVRFRAQDGMPNDHVRAMAFDRDRALWLGTIAGAGRYAGLIWQRVTEAPLADQRINVLHTDRSGRTWAGTEGAGLFLRDGATWRHFTAEDGLKDGRILAVFEDAEGQIWAGTGAGAAAWDGATWRTLGPDDGLAGVPVWSIGQDGEGRLLFGTQTGLSRWSPAAGFETVTELQKYRINALRLGVDGALWAGTDQQGLFRLQGDRWEQMPAVNDVLPPTGGPSFKSVILNGIVEEPEGLVWTGAYDDGIWRYFSAHGQAAEAGRWGEWQEVDVSLASSRLLSLVWANDSLWAGTRGGLTRFDGRSTQSYGGSVLPGPEVSALAAGVDGSLWIGTLHGLVHYRPETTPPWVRIASVNLVEPQNGTVGLRAGDRFNVRLAGGVAGARPENLKYLTQLEGVDAVPQVRPDHLVTYGDLRLGPGSYRLRAWTRDDAFNYSRPAEVVIHVGEPEPVVALPGGLSLPPMLFYPGLVLGFLALGAFVTAGGVAWQAQRKERERAAAEVARRQEALSRHFNPYISGEPVRDPDLFFGRQELLHRILNGLHQNSIMVHGERRMGKTSLLYRLSDELRAAEDPEWVFIPVPADLEGTPQSQFFYFLMDSIWGVLQAYLPQMPRLRFPPVAGASYTDRDFMADLRLLVEALKPVAAPRNVRLILLLDEMDVMNSYDAITQQQLRRLFMSSLAQNVGAVVAGVQISRAWEGTESPWYNLFNVFMLEPFSDVDARRLLTEPVRGVYDWERDALAFAVANAAGRPHRLQQYGLGAVNHMLTAGRQRIMMADVTAADRALERARCAER